MKALALHAPDSAALQGFGSGDTHYQAWPVAPGAWPPPHVVARALAALHAGEPAVWHVPFLYVVAGTVVGSGGFKGAPKAGRVEIGYGVAEAHRGRGYATAGAAALAALALGGGPLRPTQPVHEVLAETDIDNLASQRVLHKAGFLRVGERDTGAEGVVIQWLLSRRP